jgi:hypothetical protein
LTPAIELKSSAARCVDCPGPEEAKLTSPGLALAAAISSFTLLGRTCGLATNHQRARGQLRHRHEVLVQIVVELREERAVDRDARVVATSSV